MGQGDTMGQLERIHRLISQVADLAAELDPSIRDRLAKEIDTTTQAADRADRTCPCCGMDEVFDDLDACPECLAAAYYATEGPLPYDAEADEREREEAEEQRRDWEDSIPTAADRNPGMLR